MFLIDKKTILSICRSSLISPEKFDYNQINIKNSNLYINQSSSKPIFPIDGAFQII